jgi:pimaricinolide synthase PimS1
VAAAGAAGVIKMVMAMREGALPRTLHVDKPSSQVDWDAGEIELLTEPAPWLPNGRPRRAGVSSFGISGTNAHLILEEAPAAEVSEQGEADPLPSLPFLLSAKSAAALRAQAERLAAHLDAAPELELADVAYSLATARTAFEYRAVLSGGSREELLGGLRAIGRDERTPVAVRGRAIAGGRLAYLFTGQGSQRAGMGQGLHGTYPAYAAALDRACEALDPHLDRPLRDLLFSEPGSPEAELLDHTAYAQPALFATEVALFALLSSFGLEPDLLAGHSIGELAAAHVAGVFSLPDAAKLVSARGRLMGELPAGGAMLAIGASEDEAREAIGGNEAELAIAAINGPAAAVISGKREALEELEARWKERGAKSKRLTVSHAFHSPLMEPMLERFGEVAASLDYREPRIPLISDQSGGPLAPEQATDPAYWVAHVRRPVRFADAVATLRAQGASTFVELGPDAVLAPMAAECLGEEERPAALIATLRKGRPEPEALSGALAAAHAAGAKVDWEAFFAGSGAKRVGLPTYPFQRKPYWLASSGGAGEPGTIGQAAAGHPLLAAIVDEPEGGGLAMTGRVSLQSHPWLADHAVAGTVLLPGTAFVEMALRAGAEVGCELLEELTMQAPLPLLEQGAVQLRVTVAAAGEDGRRAVSIHSRPEGEAEDGEAWDWTRHAEGTLSAQPASPPEPLGTWPPQGAEALEAESVYERFAELGFDYGPAFQGVQGAWKQGETIFAEVSLAEEQSGEASRFAIHPALLDSAFHAVIWGSPEDSEGAEAGPKIPFSWNRVSVHGGPRAGKLRARLEAAGEGISLTLADPSGEVVASVGSLRVRSVSPAQLEAARHDREVPLGLDWIEVAGERAAADDGAAESPPGLAVLGAADVAGLPRYESVAALRAALAESDAPPEVVLWPLAGAERDGDGALAARALTEIALARVQEWLAAEDLREIRLAVLTRGGAAAAAGESPDLAAAAVWGLLRSAQSEHPGRFALVDNDGDEASLAALPGALALALEPQLALREGALLAPRAIRVKAPPPESPGGSIDPARTVLVTGGTGGIGAQVARHLVEAHGARQLLLVSRGGPASADADELLEQLEQLGATVRVEACDVADRAQLEELLGSIPAEHSLGAVVHSAGAIDDGMVESLGREQIAHVFAPKADAAWHLHELTADLDLSAFVLFSAAAGVIGAPGQANYAAANAFLDALAQRRHASDLPATSIAWGLWEQTTGITAQLEEADLARLKRLGAETLPTADALALFDAALESNRPLALAIRFDVARFRAQASVGALPPILRTLVRVPARRRSASAGSLARKLAALPEAKREAYVLEMVRDEAAAVLGHQSGAAVGAEKTFQELGFDSLAAVEMRNRLGEASGLQLPPTLAFDYPTPAALAGYLYGEIGEGKKATVKDEMRQLEQAVAAMPADDPGRAKLATHLRALAADLESDGEGKDGALDAGRLEAASDDELLELIDKQVGSFERD